MPKKRDILIIGAVVAIALLMLAAAQLMPKTSLEDKTADVTLAPDAVEYLDETPAPENLPAAEETKAPESAKETKAPASAQGPAPAGEQMAGPMPPAAQQKVKGHVIITVGGRQWGDPIPMDRDKIITIKQDEDRINKIHITPEEVWMESSTCENQDCVDQGHVHVDTYKERVLGTFVICLPNNVSIEMVPAQ